MRAEAVVALILGATFAAAPAARQPPAAARPPAPTATAAPARAAESAPSEIALGVTLHPSAVFLGSFDAGQGQRYYIYGSTSTFADLVTYYRGVLKTRGELVFDVPPVHMFDIGRFREESMAFPPSVTVKDYTGGGRGGYLNPIRGGQPARFPTILQVVPATAPAP